jgi:two-component system response regulator DegU
MAAKKKITVLIADDQTLFREGIKDLLEGEKALQVVGEAADGVEALRMVKKLKPNVILLDIKLPHMDGIEATRQIHRDCPDTNVLILSSYEDESHVMEAIQAGANGYLSKMLPAAELVNALKAFANDGVMIPQQVMGKLLQGLRQMSQTGGQRGSPVALTKTEIKVLALLGRGNSNKEIAAQLQCSVKTVKNHLNSVFQKLGVSNRTEAVVKGIDLGLISAEASLVALTKTEIKVLALLGRGNSNKEIAATLECSVKTVKNHLNSVFQKLGVGNRTEAVVKGIDLGLISPEKRD